MATGGPGGDVPLAERGAAGLDGFEPANDVEHALLRSVHTGSRAALLRALARGAFCVRADVPPTPGLPRTEAGGLRVPCVADGDSYHAVVYTSYEQLALGYDIAARTDVPWFEIPVATFVEHWPRDVDVWVNPGGQIGCRLGATDIAAIADLAADLEVEEAYEIGPGDQFTDFPGPSLPDQVDCAVVLSLYGMPEVLEVSRIFRRLEEPAGRTWRIVLVLTDQDVPGEHVAQRVVDAVNGASDECCEVHVADVHDDEVYAAVAPIVRMGVPLWRREGFVVPDSLAGLEQLPDDGPDEWQQH